MKKYIFWGIATFLLVGQLTLLTVLARTTSQTTDEAVHIAAGYTYVKYRDLRFNPEHPPLVKLLSGAAVALTHPNWSKESADLWQKSGDYFYDNYIENHVAGELFLYKSGNDAQKLLFTARLPVVLLTVILGLIILLTVRKIFNQNAALLALGLYAFNPVVAGHGFLVTTDIAAALGVMLAIVALWFFYTQTTWYRAAWLGLALGLAMLAKFTTILVWPIVVVVLAVKLIREPQCWQKLIGGFLLAILITWAVIIIGYGGNLQPPPKTGQVVQEMTRINNYQPDKLSARRTDLGNSLYSAFRPFLIPRDYFKGLYLVTSHVNNGHFSYLLGKTSTEGFWYYFPVLLVAKQSLAFLLMLGIAVLGVRYWQRQNGSGPAKYFLATGLGVLLMAMASRADLGVRHVLPVIVLVTVGVAAALSQLTESSAGRHWRYLVYGLFGWVAVVFIASYPNYLAYFNEAIGKDAYLVARDSNIDWGQDLYRIDEYIKKRNLTRPYLEYYWGGPGSLDYFKIDHRPGNQATPQSEGVLIIGVTFLDYPGYEYLKGRQPTEYIAPGVAVYDLPLP